MNFRLHFRPKTPPPDYEPPCHLLPPDESPFANDALPSFQMEIEPLEPLGGSVLLDHTPFVTDMFELDRRWPESSQSHFGPHDPIFEPDEEDGETVEDEQNDYSWKRVGVSSFTLTDAGGEASSCARRDSTDETSSEGGKESCGELSNGLISTQIGFTAADGKFSVKTPKKKER